VKACERILEDHRDVAAADRAQLLRRQLEEVVPLEEDLAADVGEVPVQEPHDREARHALA
jgi:hypothetical protein